MTGILRSAGGSPLPDEGEGGPQGRVWCSRDSGVKTRKNTTSVTKMGSEVPSFVPASPRGEAFLRRKAALGGL